VNLAISQTTIYGAINRQAARRRKWEWRVCDPLGDAVLQGWESTRAEAKYQAECGMVLLLMGTRPKSCPFERREFDEQGNSGKCPRTTDAVCACYTLACLKISNNERSKTLR
jgi:hypothetical protein